MQRVNDRIVRQARRFCIGTNDTHLTFFARRFGDRLPSSPLETIKLPTDEELAQLDTASMKERLFRDIEALA